MPGIFSKVLSIGSDKELKELKALTNKVNGLASKYAEMSNEELAGQTAIFRERLDKGEKLDDLLPEAFATVRETSDRVLGMRHFDVQIMGGIALHRGMIAEMKTGEGKTLVSTLAGYLNALPGTGVHIVTVNDYLARRDSEWMGQIYKFLGMEVGLLQNGMPLADKTPAYKADVTYGTNSEFGFDYLRDNMVPRADLRVQRGHAFAIVDEVDSILIDEARTPLIISGQGTKSADTYKEFARAVRGLEQGEEPEHDPLGGPLPEPDGDFVMDEAKHTIAATEQGLRTIEERLGGTDIYGDISGQLANHLQQALKAQYMYHRDKDYVVIDGEVKIVDEFTGRIMEGRRWSEGLHQAVEAKEGVLVREENQTLATITLQNYFRLYDKLSGMTGTAMTEDSEFREIYKLGVVEIPPNKPSHRVDHEDLIYRTIDYKFKAVADDIEQRHAAGQPVLVGTVSIESSERLSRLLVERGIKHEVLNAKFHEREAQIVAQAGREGAVTIATNMAGRGTDILLGGNPDELAEQMLADEGNAIDVATPEQISAAKAKASEICSAERERVLAAGGLAVLGTERHESRRIDNQLRGRSGRQGDPGETQFYLSLEDDLMRLFGADRMDKISAMMAKWNMPEDMPLTAKMVSKSIEGAQRKVEEINYAMRKNVLDYDDVMNQQRQVIYEERNKILDGKDLTEHISDVTSATVEREVRATCPEGSAIEDWDLDALRKWLSDLTGTDGMPAISKEANTSEAISATDEYVTDAYNKRAEDLGDEIMKPLSAQVMLRVIDTRWMAYLQEMDYLKTGIGLRGFGQRDPLVEYKQEAYEAFSQLVDTMYEDFLRTILHIRKTSAPAAQAQVANAEASQLEGAHYSGPTEVDGEEGAAASVFSRARAANANRVQAGSVDGAVMSVQPRAERRDVNAPAPKASAAKPNTFVKDAEDPFMTAGRNDPCPCGSGKKYKKCCWEKYH